MAATGNNYNILFEIVSEEDVKIKGHCNTNNHKNADIKSVLGIDIPDLTEKEYIDELELTNKNRWCHLFSKDIAIINFTLEECRMIKDASLIGYQTGKLPGLYKDELLELIEKIDHIMQTLDGHKYFVRLNRHSPKDGIHGAGPMNNGRMIVEALCTSMHTHKSMSSALSYGEVETLYINTWNDLWYDHASYEFRVFVLNGRITGISQYQWNKNVNLSEHIHKLSHMIIEYVTGVIGKVDWIPHRNFVVDVITINNTYVQFVELNPCGMMVAAGSCCFHWLLDYHKLYNDHRKIYIRYVG